MVPQDTVDVWQCNECPKFEYENGNGICYEMDKEVEDEHLIDERCPYRPKKNKKKGNKNK